jgi:hypothetical protein
MKPNKIGQVTKFHTPLPDENPNQLYVVLEINEGIERTRAYIKALETDHTFPLINTVLLDDLEVVEVETCDLITQKVIIRKADCSLISGIVKEVIEEKIMLDLTKKDKGIDTNVWLIVRDENGYEHEGNLFVNLHSTL